MITDSVYHKSKGNVPKLQKRWQDLYISTEDDADNIEAAEAVARGRQSRISHISRLPFETLQLEQTCILNPRGPMRVLWDCIGVLLVLYDVITIPVFVGMDIETDGQGSQFAMFIFAVAYWTLDIPLGFFTGFFNAGKLVMSRREVALRYIRTWLAFDVVIILIDYIMISGLQDSMIRMFRGARGLRMLRLIRALRLLKLSKLFQPIDDILTTNCEVWWIVFMAVSKTFCGIFIASHVLCCAWYHLGLINKQQGDPSWLDFVAATSSSEKYMQSLHFVLAHLTAAPADGSITAQNELERAFLVTLIMSSLLVLGSGISKMSSTIAELGKMNAEITDTRRNLRRYLNVSGVPVELSTRIIRFAIHSLKRKCAMSMDAGMLDLLSETLMSELTLNQRGSYLLIHPLFNLFSEKYPQIFLALCSAFKPYVYADNEVVFATGTWAKFLYITAHGTFVLRQGGAKTTYTEPHYFAEVSLFTRILHKSTLSAITFADAFMLAGVDLLECARQSPACFITTYKYAQAYLGKLWEGDEDGLPDGKSSVEDVLPKELSEQACNATLTQTCWRTASKRIYSEAVPEAVGGEAALDYLFGRDLSDDELRATMPRVFLELLETTGPYTILAQVDERKRSLAAMLSVYWLWKGQYSSFVECQDMNRRMSTELWEELQRFVVWTDMSEVMVHAMMVFLAIRGLGKAQSFAKMLPREERSPENVVIYMIEWYPEIVPSMGQLSKEMQELVKSALRTHSQFNLAQMLQGENIPSRILVLQGLLKEEEGEQLLKFCLFALLGIMSGLLGTRSLKGSLFMDEKNGCNVVLGIQCLRQLEYASPHAVYWTYIATRAGQLGLGADSPGQLALARLACLIRASSEDCEFLQETWRALTRLEREALTDHFLTDGIHEVAVLFVFLPLYFANSRSNASVGLRRALILLIELLEMLHIEGYTDRAIGMTVAVNLSDLAEFARDVKSPHIFEVTVGQSNLVHVGQELHVLVSTPHWHRVDDRTLSDDPLTTMTRSLNQVARKTVSVESQLDALVRGLGCRIKDRRSM